MERAPHSMTGVGFAAGATEVGEVRIEVRAVNGRALAVRTRRSSACAGFEAAIVEVSWYGDAPVQVQLGGAFHSRRLRLISSQVGQVAASRRARWTYSRRIQAALAMLADERLDALITHEVRFTDAPRLLPGLLTEAGDALAILLTYPEA